MASSTYHALARVAQALERIADVLEDGKRSSSPQAPAPTVRVHYVSVDPRKVSEAVLRYALRQAARGPSSQTGV